jgi:membrane protein
VKKHFIKELYQTWISERPNQLAAALAYYGMFSFAPIIFISVSIVGIFVENIDPANQLFQRVEELLGEGISDLVQESVTAITIIPSSSSVLVSVISVLALIYAASGLFYQLQFSLNIIWHVPLPQIGQTKSLIRQRLFSFLIVIGFGLLGILAIFGNLLLAWFGSVLERMLGLGGSQLLAARLFAPLFLAIIIALFYKILPETKVSWGDVWLGAIISTLLILVAFFLAGLFFQYSSLNSALQATGAFTVLLVGFYYVAQIFLLGAVCCRIYAELYGSKRSMLAQPNQSESRVSIGIDSNPRKE